ncbi:hypothetical protein SCYAM73S_03929 [Streptomyces cyaneofuscatus]
MPSCPSSVARSSARAPAARAPRPSPARAAPASGITATSTHRWASGSPNSTHPKTAVTTVPGTVKDAYAPAAPSTTAAGGTGSVA